MANPPRVPVRNSPIVSAVNNIVQPANVRSGRPTLSRGVFSAWPFTTPKYARHRVDRKHEFEDTMARMFIKVGKDDYEAFLASLQDAETREIAKVLTGDDVKQGGHGYIDFLLQNATHSYNEKVQVVETLSDNYVAFFFGHTAPVFQYQGTLMNSYQDDWTMRMFRIFRDLGRGTQLARRQFIMRLRYDSMIVSGAMMNFQWSVKAGQETACPFSFNFLVKSVQVLYGALAPPTQFPTSGPFTPADFQLAGTVRDTAAVQTYVGTPPGSPQGVSAAAQDVTQDYVQSNLAVSDPTKVGVCDATGFDATGTPCMTVAVPDQLDLEQAYQERETR